jgi:phytoene dehydrogenase-like protein
MAIGSPFLNSLPLQEHGLEWIQPQYPLAHPFDDGSAAVLERSIEATCQSLDSNEKKRNEKNNDGKNYAALVRPLVEHWGELSVSILGPINPFRHPLLLARFGLHALQPAILLARMKFKSEAARALFAGMAAHAVMPLEAWGTSAIGLVIAAMAHVAGWPIPRGGSQRIADAMVSYLRSLGGECVTSAPVHSSKDLPSSRVVLFDVSPRGLSQILGDRLPHGYRHALESFQYGPGVFKADWALRGPIPWAATKCRQAGTIHIGGTLGEIARSERQPSHQEHAERPFIILAQPSVFDPSRAPAGCHTAWAYCHVPNGSTTDMTGRIEAQIERFAPGFGKLILARATRSAVQLEEGNANLVGGDITGGANTLRQTFFRPTLRTYGIPLRGMFLCSASTPPGGGVHGMCGYHAAKRALAVLES